MAGTSGLVTIENLIEEIIGDIRDEYDVDEAEEFTAVGDGSYLIDASMDLDDINNLLDCSIDTATADTLGGYIYLALGRVPHANETITTDVLSMTVNSIDGHRIREVAVRKIISASADVDSPKEDNMEPLNPHVSSKPKLNSFKPLSPPAQTPISPIAIIVLARRCFARTARSTPAAMWKAPVIRRRSAPSAPPWSRRSATVSDDFSAVAVVTRDGGSPCGVCRQLLFEFSPGMTVIMADLEGAVRQRVTLADLLPFGFGPANLQDD